MNARARIHAMFPLDEAAEAELDKRLDEHRTDVLAEVTAWLVKKAREFHARSRKREREQGDTCVILASKIARGAVRPDNVRMLPDAGFFEPGRTYSTGSQAFRCIAIDRHPATGEIRAVGWYGPAIDGWPSVEALDPDDWAQMGWTDVTEGGEGQ